MQVHLVDGTFELFRAYYGSPARADAAGREVGAVRALVRSLLALLAEPGVTHVAVAFDHVIESFRNELYAGYKTGDGLDPVLHGQFELAEEACRALGLVVWPMVEFECDDALATAAARYAGQRSVERVVLCSPDKDLAQCVRGTRVVCLDRMRRRLLDARGVQSRFGVPPASIPDWLALVGDAADGYPGIPRWGAKSAAAVLSEYRHLERIPPLARDWRITVRGAQTLAANLSERVEEALLFRRLATLRTDVPLAESVAALHWRGPDRKALKGLAARWRDPSLEERAADVARRVEARGMARDPQAKSARRASR
ncbi:MAG TPA: 5'-3' exonuclease H3TH domain-containing protein [Gammaproteobacteria bacterium]|jgi:5'-3' exonuclease|nr:5'-3' exonuclease H3TH domain-containing protein [Gammaproteobacteria bacterium]